MFAKLAISLLALSSAAIAAAAGKKCTRSTVTTTSTTTAPAVTVTSTPGPVFELIGYPEQLCGVPQVAKNNNAPAIQIVELVYNPSARNSNCAALSGNAQSFSFTTVASPPLAAVPSGCQLIFYRGEACYNNVKSFNVLASSTGICQNGKARSVRLFC